MTEIPIQIKIDGKTKVCFAYFQIREAVESESLYFAVFQILAEDVPTIPKFFQRIRLDSSVACFFFPIFQVVKTYNKPVLNGTKQAVQIFKALGFPLFELYMFRNAGSKIHCVQHIESLEKAFV